VSTERRYTDAETAEIMDRASRGDLQRTGPPVGHALTLSEIQEIALEVGIAPQDVAAAAGGLVTTDSSRTPLSALRRRASSTRVVVLDAPPSEAEWEAFVVSLREIFGTPGDIEQSGKLRSWRTKGVEVHGEPDGPGYRIRVQAKGGTAVDTIGAGASSIALGAAMFGGLVASGAGDAFTYGAAGLLAGIGVVFSLAGSYILSRWKRRTAHQLAEVSRRIAVR